MHRATPLNSSFRAYSAGGARSVVDKVDDKKLMQEMSGNMMRGENRGGMESPQNYGFTSVNMPADKDKDGNISMGSETFISFMGGNRSFPVAGPIDDRRHRLKSDDKKKLADGDSAMYRTKDDMQQFHLNENGNFMSSREDKVNRIALVPKQQDQQQQGGQQGGQQGQQKKATGQTHLLDENKKSKIASEQNSKENFHQHGDAFYSARGGSDSSTYYKDRSISAQSTANHTHIRCKANHIWVDSGGCYSDMPIIIQQDQNCKD